MHRTLMALINGILEFSRLESGQLDLELVPVNLRECLEGALDLTRDPASDKCLELLYWIEEDVPQVILGDPTRLRQVFINLIHNAVKFTAQELWGVPSPDSVCLDLWEPYLVRA